ncbi:hypothetical protein THRCLA_05289 [Thraustotheca clavata]|uniref:Transmembrane protein n=1 Tax=Thraustotheca clavata TaxID=74557 RepID=A0A1V9ZWE1_9STRA|nr:hypothetical protein THRCLA_05289 [Thraustotheca clavata]
MLKLYNLHLYSTSIILHQPLLLDEWFFFGYIGLYQWVFGHREVISFKRDAGIVTILSEPLSGISFAVHEKDIPSTTSQCLWITTIATTFVLLAVALATIAIYIGCESKSSYHLFFLIAFATAIIVLSASNIVFYSSGGLGQFQFELRLVGYCFLLASEASWLTDVTTDILLVFTEDITLVQAPLSSLPFWLAIVFLESFSPIRATASVEQSCASINMDKDLTCTSGVVNVGPLNRALVIVGLNLMCLIIATVLAKLYHIQHEKSMMNMLPASALAFCSPNGSVWTIDASIASMCGIFRYYHNGVQQILDTKLWIIFTEHELSPIETRITPRLDYVLTINSTLAQQRKQQFMLLAGLLCFIRTVVGSISYIRLADVNFGFDFWWAKFNSTGTLTFIANWYDKYRIFTTQKKTLLLHIPHYIL